MFPDLTSGPWSAFLAGLIVSPHCVGMCGPLFCSLIPTGQTNGNQRDTAQLAYHSARIVSYVTIGFLAGTLSLGITQLFDWNLSRFFPWALIVMLFIVALGADQWLFRGKKAPLRPVFKWTQWLRTRSPITASSGLGLLTPLLPCAPLYMVLWVALVSASPWFGAQLMLGFSLGTIPLLWIAQSSYLQHREKWASATIRRVQRGLAAVAAAILLVRVLWIGSPLDGAACIVS